MVQSVAGATRVVAGAAWPSATMTTGDWRGATGIDNLSIGTNQQTRDGCYSPCVSSTRDVWPPELQEPQDTSDLLDILETPDRPKLPKLPDT